MASRHSYGATLINNKTEKDAVSYLLSTDARYQTLTKEERAHIMRLFNLEKGFSRAFDLVWWRNVRKPFAEASSEDLILVELKTSKKYLPHNPAGFFFGATENEFALARLLGESYKFCFISLNEKSTSAVLLSLAELEVRTRTKRTQYQINLANKA